jgi:hypothetical protein
MASVTNVGTNGQMEFAIANAIAEPILEMFPEDEGLCAGCCIVPIESGDKYCLSCVDDILEYLARQN